MTIELPDMDLGSEPLSSADARLDFAIGLYTSGHASLGRAAKVASLPKLLFMRELGKRGVPCQFTVEDFEHDLRVVEELVANSHAA